MKGIPALLLSLLICIPSYAKNNEERLLSDISSKLSASLDTMRSWSEDNRRQTEELRENAEKAMKLAGTDHETPDRETWSKLDELNENSLGLLHASSSLWESYGSMSAYIASFKKAEAWQECVKSHKHCSFREVLSRMDSNSIDYATRAMRSAEENSKAIGQSIRKLEELSFEARGAVGLGAGLDTLSKVNAASAASLADLGTSINTLLRIQAHEQAVKHNQALAQQEGSREALEGGDSVRSPHFNLELSSHVGN